MKKIWYYAADEINQKAAGLAKSIAKDGSLVAGNMGPCGELLQPEGPLSYDEVKACFGDQARVLAENGVDLFLLQTFFSLKEILLAVEGVQSVTDLPIFASMAFRETPRGFTTIMGDGVAICMNALMDAGALVVGANCSIGSASMIHLAEAVRKSVPIPVMAEPNAGVPELWEGKTIYSEDAPAFAENIDRIKALGVEVIGGCCGTTPDHIWQMVQKIGARST